MAELIHNATSLSATLKVGIARIANTDDREMTLYLRTTDALIRVRLDKAESRRVVGAWQEWDVPRSESGS